MEYVHAINPWFITANNDPFNYNSRKGAYYARGESSEADSREESDSPRPEVVIQIIGEECQEREYN